MTLTLITSEEFRKIYLEEETKKINSLRPEEIQVLKKFRDENRLMILYRFMYHSDLNEAEQKIVRRLKRLEIVSYNKSIGYTLSYSRIIQMVRDSK